MDHDPASLFLRIHQFIDPPPKRDYNSTCSVEKNREGESALQIRRELKSLTCLLIIIQCLAASAIAGDRAKLKLGRSIFGPTTNSPARADLNAEAASVGAKGPALR